MESYRKEERKELKQKESGSGQWRKHIYNLLMMFMTWSALVFSVNLLIFYTKHLPGEVYTTSTFTGFAALAFALAGPLGIRIRIKRILNGAFAFAFVGSLGMLVMIVNHDADFLAVMVFVTRCGHNLAFCFIFIIHTELFPTSFLATSYGLCSFVSRGVTLFAPLIAESANHWVPIGALSITCLLGLIGSLMIKT